MLLSRSSPARTSGIASITPSGTHPGREATQGSDHAPSRPPSSTESGPTATVDGEHRGQRGRAGVGGPPRTRLAPRAKHRHRLCHRRARFVEPLAVPTVVWTV